MSLRVLRPRHALSQTATRVTYRFQTCDNRLYTFDHVVNRMRQAVVRGSGELKGGIHNLPRKILRWTLLRSPHVNKTSREKFWMINYRRMFHWDAPLHIVEPSLATDLADRIPATVAVQVIKSVPALAELRGVYDTIQTIKGSGVPDSVQLVESSAEPEQGAVEEDVVRDADEAEGEGDGEKETVSSEGESEGKEGEKDRS